MQQSRLLDLNGAWTTCQRDNFGERWIGRKAGRGPPVGRRLASLMLPSSGLEFPHSYGVGTCDSTKLAVKC